MVGGREKIGDQSRLGSRACLSFSSRRGRGNPFATHYIHITERWRRAGVLNLGRRRQSRIGNYRRSSDRSFDAACSSRLRACPVIPLHGLLCTASGSASGRCIPVQHSHSRDPVPSMLLLGPAAAGRARFYRAE